ncbi:hypothetical protein NHX12_005864 [Muraenolepis orangiensis]|uniref:phosphatidate phosphatase n=1 Tax=Muraenolepis orangiensis TaxID=630683 RepID=A0A9Q0ICK8_9TELE|nr:hypothetical protein NHX12_005864 [Muraenolepis orangiensis]
MNYVGQLAGQVFVQVKELYRGLNPATLSGCIDVIVVRRPDGSLHCSPFHVRFGKIGVLRSREKVVDIEINGEVVSLHMKLGDKGEAFFVTETEDMLEVVPSHLATSPIMSTGEELMEAQLGKTAPRHRDRRLSISCPQQISHFPFNSTDSCSSTPKSDSELSNQSKDNPEMLWTWGEMPHAAQPSFLSDHQTDAVVPSGTRATLPDSGPPSLDLYDPQPGDPRPGDPSQETPPGDPSQETPARRPPARRPPARRPQPGDPGQETTVPGRPVEGLEGEALCGEMEASAPCSILSPGPLLDHLEQQAGTRGSPVRRTDSPSKRKEKRSQHLGSNGVYLDDITELEPDVAALYFPKTDGVNGSVPRCSEMTRLRSDSQSPQSLGSSEADSGVDSLSEHAGDLPHVAISLCGGLTANMEITCEQFLEKAITYQQFSNNPSLIDDPNLVVKLGTKYYNWNTAAPLMLAMQVYQKPLPQASVENLMKERMPKKGGRWWFSWRSRNSESNLESDTGAGDAAGGPIDRMKDESSSSDDEHSSSANQRPGSCKPEPLVCSGPVCYKKTLRLSSDQLASLQLKEGPNDVVFSVTTQYQGTCRCHGTIYLWNWDDKIVISDIDGTITRSDTLGHILPNLGKDWTHQDIARLYHKVGQNGYKFMYCSARAIGMADMTRGYLHWVNERGTVLEVIEKKPEKFKIKCLSDIKHLFSPNTEPFYAAFGNRATEHAKTNISSYGHLCEVVDHVFPLFSEGQGSEDSQFPYWTEESANQEEEDSQPLE